MRMGRLFVSSLILCVNLSLLDASPGAVDPSFDAGSRINGAVGSLLPQADGKILITGGFTSVAGGVRPGIARLNANGQVDTTFSPDLADLFNARILGIQSDGRIVLLGWFQAAAGSLWGWNLVRLHPDGTRDMTFNAPSGGFGLWGGGSGALQSDGKILVATATEPTKVFRFNGDGSLDLSFSSNVSAGGALVAPQPDGRILIDTFVGNDRTLARLNTDGSLDSTFHSHIEDTYKSPEAGFSIARQADGKILVAGLFQDSSGNERGIVRLNPDGTLDGTFDSTRAKLNSASHLAVLADGQLLVAGSFPGPGAGMGQYLIARLKADGSLDPAFQTRAIAESYGPIALSPDGAILVAMGSIFASPGVALVRLDADGHTLLDTSSQSSTGPDGPISAIARQPDGKLLVAGGFTTINERPLRGIARLNPDGKLDSSFDPRAGANNSVITLAVQPDGKVLAGGWFDAMGGTVRNAIARLNSDGTLDQSFDARIRREPNNPARITSIAVAGNGKVLIAGGFQIDGMPRQGIARLSPDGSPDLTFGARVGGDVIVLQADGKVLVGGTRGGIARLNPDGSVDATFAPDIEGSSLVPVEVKAIALQSDGKVLISGSFRIISGMPRNGLARLNPDGSLDASFNPSIDVTPVGMFWASVAVQPDHRILVGGLSQSPNGTAHFWVARLNEDGGWDKTFNPPALNEMVSCIAVQPDGNAIIGGSFTAVNGLARAYVARLLGDPIPALRIQRTSDAVILGWEDAAYSLQSAPSPFGPFITVLSATSGHSVPTSGAQRYFRLRK